MAVSFIDGGNWEYPEKTTNLSTNIALESFTTVRPGDNITYKYVFLCVCHDLLISKIKSTIYSIVRLKPSSTIYIMAGFFWDIVG
jgi:hypothetical protein